MNIGDVFSENARLPPDHPAVEEGDRIVSYAELADRAAAGLVRDGVKPGDIVAFLLPYSLEQVALA